jgi:hypothetical protein
VVIDLSTLHQEPYTEELKSKKEAWVNRLQELLDKFQPQGHSRAVTYTVTLEGHPNGMARLGDLPGARALPDVIELLPIYQVAYSAAPYHLGVYRIQVGHEVGFFYFNGTLVEKASEAHCIVMTARVMVDEFVPNGAAPSEHEAGFTKLEGFYSSLAEKLK